MPNLATRQLLRRLAAAFAVSFVSLTVVLLANYAARRLPELRASGAPAGTIVDVLLLAVPFTAAMTIPMAVFVAVLAVFTRLGAEGTLAVARREPDGIRRLVAPVLGAAICVGALTLVSNAQIVPRANERLAAALAGGAPERGDRMMTIGELRTAARSARADTGPDARARAAYYEVEIQKKYALAAACVVLALAGAAIPLLFPRGGGVLVIGASLAVFSAYYVCLVAGESLADRLVVSPFAAMWMANALLLTAALLVMWRSRWSAQPVTRHHMLAVVLAAAVGLLARPASAQTTNAPARPLFAAGLAVGTATQPDPVGADPLGGRLHSALLATVAPRHWPVEFRGELTWVRWSSYAGPVSLTANAVVPVGHIALGGEDAPLTLRPYAIGGLGVYGVGSVPPRKGHWNVGGGLRLAGVRRAVFLEARQLAAYRRTSLAGGFTLGF